MKRLFLMILILFGVIIYLIVAQNLGQDREKRFYLRFNESDISGKLEYAKIGYHGSVFKIEGIDKEFVFYPFASESNNNVLFYNIAKKGDFIIKEAHSNILKVKKNDKVYQFKFRKPND